MSRRSARHVALVGPAAFQRSTARNMTGIEPMAQFSFPLGYAE